MQGLINGMSSADIEGFITDKISGMTGSAGGVLGANLVTEAEKYLGTPYVWGGTTTAGFDCSGLVQYVYKQLGITIGRDTTAQVKQGTTVAKKDLQPGDIVFFGANASSPEHEAMYVGNGKVIEAPHTGENVKEVALSSFDNYLTAKRIITESTNSTATTNASVTSILTQAMQIMGVSASQLAGYQKLVQAESSGSQTVVNPTSVNGQHATGLTI